MIAWNQFTPLSSLLGGLLIGIAVALLMVLNGRIAGISGIAGGLFGNTRTEISWRLAFLSGLIAAPIVWRLWTDLPAVQQPASLPWLILAGLLVGIGTRLGNGCTSGHGICGLARLSPRSLAATIIFMLAGMASVWVLRHVTGWVS